jgi:hypothetical protein
VKRTIQMDRRTGQFTAQYHTTTALAMIDLTSVHRDAIRVPFDKVRAGDWVFDAWGERHKVTRARVLVNGDLSIKREDRPRVEHIAFDEHSAHPGQIVIVPEHGWTQDGHGYRSVYEDGKRVGGEFYETCRCGQTFGSGPAGDESAADYLLRKHADEANGRSFYNG